MFNERLRENLYGDIDLEQGPYSFAAYDEERGLVAMRLAIKRWPSSPNMTDFITLGLWVKPRSEYREAFKRAQDAGWLLSQERVVKGFGVFREEVE